MKIALDISPISSKSTSNHKVRGVGKYISILHDNLQKYDQENEYIFLENPKEKNYKVDLVHYPYLDPFFVTFPIIKKQKTIITVHDLIPIAHKTHFPPGVKGNISWLVNRRILKSSDAIITDSVASSRSVENYVGISSNKVKHVYLGISEVFQKLNISKEEKERISKKYSVQDNFFLYVGDVTWNKNLPTLVEAVKKANVNLVMVGKALVDEYDKSNVWNKDRVYVEKNTDSKLFNKLGFVDERDLVALYNMATGVIMPSIDEGFGLPVLEGMSCGAPVIVSRKGSLPEVAGDAGVYIEEGNVESIAEALRKLSSNEEFQKKQSLLSLKQAREFSIEKMIKDTVKVYQSVL